MESKLAAMEVTIRNLTNQQLELARAYDPSCDEYVHQIEMQKMRAAREAIEAIQSLAVDLGRNPEGCLLDVLEDLRDRAGIKPMSPDVAALVKSLDSLESP